MIKKIKLEIDCTGAIKKGAKYVAVDRDGDIFFFKNKPFIVDYCWSSKCFDDIAEKRLCDIANWENLCFEIAQNKPIWLTEKYEKILIEDGYNFIACDKFGDWFAYKEKPVIMREESCYYSSRPKRLHCDLTENYEWENSLIELMEKENG